MTVYGIRVDLGQLVMPSFVLLLFVATLLAAHYLERPIMDSTKRDDLRERREQRRFVIRTKHGKPRRG